MGLPIIGITTYNDLNLQGFPSVILLRAYVSAILNAGGTPVLIPSGLPEEAGNAIFNKLDGILFTGGGDISLDHFSGIDHPSITNVDNDRDLLELSLAHAAIHNNKPFMGICRGLQLLNVVLGGTLYTHIAAQKKDPIKHDYYPDIPRDFLAHTVRIIPKSKLSKIIGSDEIEVNSLHHQGLKDLADDLQPCAFAPDGLVEAVELPGHKFGIAVQWHPEWLTEQNSMCQLFLAFIQAASN